MKTTRRQRRAYLKWLKKNDPKAYKEAQKEIKRIGKDLHRRHVAEQMNKAQEKEAEELGDTPDLYLGSAPISFSEENEDTQEKDG